MTDNDRIKPRTLKGFRDFLPEAMAAREHIIDTAKAVFQRYGFSPIDTPVLEYSEILLGKGSDETDKQMYRFMDNGGRDVAMRFDLTVPLARFMAQHVGSLGTPFKRYHVGLVWRAENTQRGRYREFLQCDFDTIGTESVVADIETGLVIHDLFLALGFERFTIRLNDRRVLNGVLERHGLSDRSVEVLRALDKLGKIGVGGVRSALLDEVGVSELQADGILQLAELGRDQETVLRALPDLVDGSEVGARGVSALEACVEGMVAAGADRSRIALDVSTARGLDYYTGVVMETFLDDLPDIGSCCSGGRYDDLASLYTKQRLPGVGASLGVDRLLAAMESLKATPAHAHAADVLITQFDADHTREYLALAGDLRRQGVSVEVYPDARKLGAQLKYADRRGHRFAVIIGDVERQAGTAQLKTLATGESVEVPRTELAARLRDLGARLG